MRFASHALDATGRFAPLNRMNQAEAAFSDLIYGAADNDFVNGTYGHDGINSGAQNLQLIRRKLFL